MPRRSSQPASSTAVPTAGLARLLGEPSLPTGTVEHLARLLSGFNPNRQKLALDLWQDDHKPFSHLAVVVPDQPFLTDTVTLCARRWGLDITDLRHPVLAVARNADGSLEKLSGANKEALIYLQLPALSLTQAEQLQASVRTGLAAAQQTVADFPAMRSKVEDERHRLAATRQADREELQFIDWLLNNHFVFLGLRQYRYRESAGGTLIQMVPSTGLGTLRNAPSRAEHPIPVSKLGVSLANYLDQPGAVVISKAFSRAPIHRDAAMDYIALRTLDAAGKVLSEWRILGLFTSKAYTAYAGDIPLLSSKIAEVKEKSGFAPNSYSARVLENVLETWPRDELFLSDINTLSDLAMQAVAMRERAETAILVRQSRREEALSVQVLVPGSRYEARLRRDVAAFLTQNTLGEVTDQRLDMGEGDIVRLFFRVHTPSFKHLKEADIATRIRQLIRGWADETQHLLCEHLPLAAAVKAWQTIGPALPGAYRANQAPAQAAADIEILHHLPAGGAVCLATHGQQLVLRAYRAGGGWPLHQLLPVLASFGLNTAQEQHYQLNLPGGPVSLQVVEIEGNHTLPPEALEKTAALALQALKGEAESDHLNSLVVTQNLALEEVNWLRAWAACLQQADRRFNTILTHRFLTAHPAIGADIVTLFRARLQPHHQNQKKAARLHAQLHSAITALPSAEDEHIGTCFLQLIGAMVRTNAWQQLTPALAFKLDGAHLHAWPQPHVFKEIFVYHPAVEGAHLRGGPVARGGLRHSDRPYDYRTEVLGLQQAQQRKNSIIVPLGAKGGFYIKQRGMLSVEGYKLFVSALLSVTDTYDAKGKAIHPRNVVCLDGADPYLVVAADKGTATFSDTANGLSLAADFWDGIRGGFWLGDAFASGGSNGYDHKELAITARGAWLSVEHHLKALSILPSAKKPLTMVGVGDPSGDVFGNGVVREPHAQLIAAFNHKHIFLDPEPDTAKAFAERQRLLKEVRGWDAYNPKLISAGGGVFPRSAKKIPLSAKLQQRLNFKKKEATPDELIKAILKAPVDVLWNGGIGTYIRASDERDEEVGDKANDAVRVAAKEVGAKVIGEGGNLGISPRGRVELSLHGVKLNSDALDNSAGVDTSDHEVNLKILLGTPSSERNALLKKCTDDIADAVLTDNIRQNLAISLEVAAPAAEHRDLFALQQSLLKKGVLSEVVDNLPSLPALLQRPQPLYTRPETAGLLAGTKLTLREELLKPDLKPLLTSPLGQAALKNYFPASLPKTILSQAPDHALAADITATVLANRIVNRLGLLMVPHLCADLGTTPACALQAVLLAEDWLTGESFWREMDSLEHNLSMPALLAAYQRIRAVVSTVAGWLVQHNLSLAEATALGEQAREAMDLLPKLLSKQAQHTLAQRIQGWKTLGFDVALGERLSLLSPSIIVPDAVLLARHSKHPVKQSLKLQLELGENLQLASLVQKARGMNFADGWSRQAVVAMVLEFIHCQRRLTGLLLQHKMDVPAWQKKHAEALARYHATVKQALHEKQLTVAMLSVVVGRLRELAG